MRATLGRSVLLVLVLAAASVAQPSTGTHHGLWVGMFNSGSGIGHVLTLDAQNKPTTFTTSPTGAWPYWGNPFGACMDTDNQHLLVPVLVGSSVTAVGLAAWDCATSTVTTLRWQSSAPGALAQNWGEVTINSDGEFITLDSSASPNQTANLFEMGTGLWRQVLLPATTRPGAGLPLVQYHRLDGKVYWGAFGTPTELYRSARDFAVTTTLSTGPLRQAVGRYGGCVLENGDVLIATCCTSSYWMLKSGTSSLVAGPLATNIGVNYDLAPEHYAKPGMGVWGAIWGNPRGVQHIDLSTATPTVTTLHLAVAASMPTNPIEVVELYDNDLNTVRTGARTWDVNINPGHGRHAKKLFKLVVSLTGAMKIPIAPGGREIFITPDDATLLSSNGQLTPFLSGNIGFLNGAGTATAKLDLTALGTTANGRVIHMAALVFDLMAPQGIAHVCQPWAFVINNR